MKYELSRQTSQPQIPQFYEEFWREIHRQGPEDCTYVETAMGISPGEPENSRLAAVFPSLKQNLHECVVQALDNRN
jgi:hypothetical protein